MESENCNVGDMEMTSVILSAFKEDISIPSEVQCDKPSLLIFLHELRLSLYEARFWAPTWALLGFVMSLYLTTSPYQRQDLFEMQMKQIKSNDDMKRIRPTLEFIEIDQLQRSTMYAESDIVIPNNDNVQLRFFMSASNEGHFRLPGLFYNGVTFGVTSENPFTHNPGVILSHLKEVIQSMKPLPTHIMHRVSRNQVAGWEQTGFAVYFSKEDLIRQNSLSETAGDPWEHVREQMLVIARQFKQVFLFQWAPYSFGVEVAEDPLLHSAVLQRVFPTRTGLNDIQSSVIVWLAAVNGTPPTRPKAFYKRSEISNSTQTISKKASYDSLLNSSQLGER